MPAPSATANAQAEAKRFARPDGKSGERVGPGTARARTFWLFMWLIEAPRSKVAMSKRDREICEAIGPVLREKGLVFVGIDVIGDYLTEINVTSPTGIREIKRFGGPDIAALIWDAIEARRG